MKPRLERVSLSLDGRRLVLRRRPGTAPGRTPAFLLHALAGSWRWWRFTVEHLSEERELWLPDLPGFGESRGRPPPVPTQADLVAAALAALGIPRAHVAGHSMGGGVAAELAARHPGRVASLALVNPIGWPTSFFPRYLGRLAQPWSWCPVRFLPTLVGDVVRTRPPRLARGIRHVVEYDIRPTLGRVTAPTRIVWGERDRLLPLEHGRAMAALLPQATLEPVAGAGHIVPADRPAELARILDRFWDGL